MNGVESIEQLDKRTLHFQTRLTGTAREWDTVITQQFPDEQIAWRSTRGTPNAGHVSFTPLGTDTTRVELSMHFEPHDVAENLWTRLGLVGRRVDHDMHHFKEFIESRGRATGAWRGVIHQPEPRGARNPKVSKKRR